MKTQVILIRFCRVMNIYQMRSLMYSETGCMSTKVMTGLTRRILKE